MQITVTFRHMSASEPLRQYTEEKLERVVEKYIRASHIEGHAVLSVERHWHIASFSVLFAGLTVSVEERSDDMYSSIDLAMDKIERQVKRYKDKMRDHKPGTEETPTGEWLDDGASSREEAREDGTWDHEAGTEEPPPSE